MDTDQKAALGLAAALGVPWLLVAALGLGVIPREASTVVAAVGVSALAALTAWGWRQLREIRAFATGEVNHR